MSSNFSPEDIARFQTFLNQLSTSTPQISNEPPSVSPTISNSPFGSSGFTPSALASQASTQADIPPVSQLYHSNRQGHPMSQSGFQSQPSGFHPLVGTRLNLPTTSIANQARLASANNTLPRQVSLPIRGRRRAMVQQAPVLPRFVSKKVTVDDCLVSDASVRTVRIVARVFPPLFDSKQRYLVYQNLRDSVDSWLIQHHLLHRMNLPTSTSHISLITSITTAMTTSPLQYKFPSPRSEGLAVHETLSLQPLCLSAKGAPRANGQIYLRPVSVKSGILLENLMSDVYAFSGKPCIEGNEWALNFVISAESVTFLRDHSRHSCLGYWFCRQFSGDMARPSSSVSYDDNSSGGEVLTEDDDTMNEDLDDNQMSLVRAPPSEPSFIQRSRFLPAKLWATDWTSHTSPLEHSINLESLAETVFECAAGQTDIQLLVVGHDLNSLVLAFEEVIAECLLSGDFTQLLLPNRTFQINQSNGQVQTVGPGLERDVISSAFSVYITSFSKWFLPRFDDRASLQMSCGFWRAISGGVISENRLMAMKKLGAICALMLIHGICPEPLNPLIFQFIIHDGNFESLHRSLIQEWHPDLLHIIDRWLAIRPEDSLEPFRAHFATYHDIDISALDRNVTAQAPEMLYYAIFGSEPPFHPEWKAFIQGFSLKCRNGFTFLNIPKAFEGGSEAFLTLLWTSIITGYESIRSHTLILRPPPPYTHALQATTSVLTTVHSLITNFLQGSGIPCPTLFAEVQDGLSSLVSLDKIDTKSYRSRMFFWAATGSPTVDPNLENVSIGIASDTDPQYADSQNRPIMLAAGKISFRTCLRSVRLPGSYILGLAQASYPALSVSGEPRTFVEAFDHWFLCEILTAIGGHSML